MTPTRHAGLDPASTFLFFGGSKKEEGGPRIKSGVTLWVVLGLCIAAPASGQQNRPEYLRALAAGYKASFLCSDLFNAGQTEAQVEADDLKPTYSEIEPLMRR
jgi:hypothetical protein